VLAVGHVAGQQLWERACRWGVEVKAGGVGQALLEPPVGLILGPGEADWVAASAPGTASPTLPAAKVNAATAARHFFMADPESLRPGPAEKDGNDQADLVYGLLPSPPLPQVLVMPTVKPGRWLDRG
jgi:hypothetical protein